MIGTNAKMSEYLAAVGLTSFRSRKLEAASWKQVNDFALQIDKTSNFHSIISKLPGYRPYWIQQFEDIKTRNRVEKIFFENGIQTRKWWERPLSKMPAFAKAQSLGSRVSSCLSETTLGLPMYRDLKKSDFKFILDIMGQI
jgi:dTDP-4-amino-4,6-dideoxygalactose transaminase